MEKIKLLLIDDDADDREVFAIAIDESQVDAICETVATCSEALQILDAGDELPDYIFLDLNMPKMDGRECLCELKSRIALKNIPVIIYTTSSLPMDVQDTKQMGAKAFITKPSKISELTKILTSFFHKEGKLSQFKTI